MNKVQIFDYRGPGGKVYTLEVTADTEGLARDYLRGLSYVGTRVISVRVYEDLMAPMLGVLIAGWLFCVFTDLLL